MPSFSRLLRPEMDRSLGGDLSSLLTDEHISELKTHLPRLRMWHPHLSDLDSLCIAFRERNKPSSSLLLATVCLVTSKMAGKRHLAKQFAIHVDRIGLQVLISAPKEFHAAQAFELLLSHEPSLIGASVDPSGAGAASTDSAVFGQSLHSSAISIAEAIGLDLVMSQAYQNGAKPTQPRSQDHDRARSDLRRFSLWCSLSIWRAKFIFLNSILRPLDFSRLRRDAEAAIQVVDMLPQQAHYPAKDNVLFRAGVLALAYRAIQLADFHARLSQLDTLWNSRSLFSEVEVRNEIRSRFDQNLAFVQELERTKRRKLWSMANLAELRFLDRFLDLEFGSDSVFLYCLYVRMVLPLPSTKAAATVHDIGRLLDRDPGLYGFLWDVSERSFLNDEKVIAGFAATPRFEGGSLEQTGLPLLLTCGYVLHISICMMEAAAFAQYGSYALAMRVDMFAHLLPQLAERICGPERAKIESLETLVSSMLMQMARRLDELEFYMVTQEIKQPPAASTAQLASIAPSTNGHHPHRSSSQLDSSAPLSERARESSPQRGATLSNEPSPTHHTRTSSTNWQDTSDIGQSDQSQPAPHSATRSQSSHIHSHNADGSIAGIDSQVPGEASFPTNANSLLPSSDAWSSDNMARIMDQILSWDYMQDVPPTTNGSSQA
uniref:Transcription factor domain-containing protein n=2 Tax=Kalmanozyma brasiliensis (strain GHG001) TaxID=1365824 RepID=V5EXN0_KALBG